MVNLRNFDLFFLCLQIAVIVDANRNKYCRLTCDNDTHTVCVREKQKCGASAQCGPGFKSIKLTDDDRQYVLDIHNYFRNKVAAGHQKGQPSAANMNALSYNKELEFIAQCWANACKSNPLEHDVCRRTSEYEYVGQNLGWWATTAPNINMVEGIKNSIMGWYNEVDDFSSSLVTSFNQEKKTIGHYTQMIWADTLEIGCGISYYTSIKEGRKWHEMLFACNYGPGGNYIGNPVYKIGKPASRCSRGKANKKYKALCGQDKPLNMTAKYKNDFFKVSI